MELIDVVKCYLTWAAVIMAIAVYGIYEIDNLKTDYRWPVLFTWCAAGWVFAIFRMWC